jgi:hypothetical protein
MEALLRGELAEDGIDARAAVTWIVGTAQHIKKRLDELAGVKEQ